MFCDRTLALWQFKKKYVLTMASYMLANSITYGACKPPWPFLLMKIITTIRKNHPWKLLYVTVQNKLYCNLFSRLYRVVTFSLLQFSYIISGDLSRNEEFTVLNWGFEFPSMFISKSELGCLGKPDSYLEDCKDDRTCANNLCVRLKMSAIFQYWIFETAPAEFVWKLLK